MLGPRGITRAAASAALYLLLSAPAMAAPGGGSTAEDTAAADLGAPPELRWGERTICTQAPDGAAIRIQCDRTGDGKPGACLWHPECRPGTSGEDCARLERLADCDDRGHDMAWRFEALTTAGYQMVEARPATPPGWRRDAAGRIFQVDFDLDRRIWIGSGWQLAAGPNGRVAAEQASFDVGLRGELLSDDLDERYRFLALTGAVSLNPLSARATLLRADASYDRDKALLRITTFIGPPARHDLFLNLGWWGELGTVEHRPRASGDDTAVRIAAAGPTWDLWHDADMTSFARLRTGVALDDLIRRRPEGATERLALTPLAALEGDFTLDGAGYHHLLAQTSFEALFTWDGGLGEETTLHKRFLSEVSYEVILIAINDQPVTVRAAVGGGYRDDLAAASGWELTAGLGLRANLWAPARDLSAREAAEARQRRLGRL